MMLSSKCYNVEYAAKASKSFYLVQNDIERVWILFV